MPELQPISNDNKLLLVKGLGAIAKQYGLYLQTCASKDDYLQFGVHHSGCMTTEIFSRALGLNFKHQAHKGNRIGCACMESRGLGDYNSCPNGCRYCYANKDHAKAAENYRRHDPKSPLLLGDVLPTDTIKPAVQKSLIDKWGTLF